MKKIKNKNKLKSEGTHEELAVSSSSS